MKKSKIKYYLIAIISTALYVFPIYILLSGSFKTQKGIFSDPIGLPNSDTFSGTNYIKAAEKMDFFHAFFNSVIITLVSTILIILLTSMCAWVISRRKNKLSNVIYIMLAVSMLIPFQCVMLPLVRVLSKINCLNPIGLVISYIGFGSALSTLLYFGFIKNIPIELEEAARIDGCSQFKIFWKIIFPILTPTTITVSILNIMWIWNDFLLPNLVINSNPAWRTLPLKTYYFFGQFSSRWDLATAALILCMIPIIIFYILAQKKIMKGMIDCAIK